MSKKRYLFLNGKRIFVSEEVYRTYMRPVWAARRQAARKHEKGEPSAPLSVDALIETGDEPASNERLVSEIVEDKMLLEMLCAALQELSEDERSLIDALYYEETSERQLAREMHIPLNTLAYRKMKILAKLKKYFEKS